MTRTTTITLPQGTFTAETDQVIEWIDTATRRHMLAVLMESQDEPATFTRADLDELPTYALAVLLSVR